MKFLFKNCCGHTVDSIDSCTFVVPSKQEEALRILYFICKKETYSFKALFASIHIVAEK